MGRQYTKDEQEAIGRAMRDLFKRNGLVKDVREWNPQETHNGEYTRIIHGLSDAEKQSWWETATELMGILK